MPTLYLSNWSSHRTKGQHGPGRKWSIMRHLEAENAALRETLGKVREAMPAGSTCWEGCNASDAIERVLAILDGGTNG